jgi:predicted pyridoxine 5'-phosphate oxidase superfamily flavin-nucleotide-binding protein
LQEKGHVDVTDVLAEQLAAGGLDPATAAVAAEQEVWGFSGPIPTLNKLAW